MGFGKDGKGVIIRQSLNQAIGTLAAQVSLLIGTKPATLERFRIIKAEIYATITGATSGELNGMFLGLADGDFSNAEIEAAIEANGPQGPNDQVGEELAERFIMMFGATDRETGTELVFHNDHGGHIMSETVRWTFARTKSWNWFIYNMGAAPTTGASVIIRAKLFGVWVT